MKINSIDIAAFGKFKNYHLDLSDGFTVIFGENEKGKSTIMAFVRMMFYGNTGKASGIDKNPRKKYRPWNSDIMAGSITFVHAGVTYRLEREFKSSNSTDKISLINLDLNEKQTLSGGEDIGAKFFGLTDAAFERSVFVSDPRLTSKNEAADGEINTRLSNIATTSDDDVSFEKIYLRLRSAKEALISKSRKIGKLDKAETEIAELDKKISNAKATEDSVISLKALAALKEAEIKESSNKASVLFEQLKNSDKIKKKNFLARYIDAEKERAAAKQRLSLKYGGFADRAYIDSIKSLAEEISALSDEQKELLYEKAEKTAEIEALKTELAGISKTDENEIRVLEKKREATEDEIDACKNTAEILGQELGRLTPLMKNNVPLIIVGAVLAALGAASFFLLVGQLVKMISLGAVLVGLILFILGFVLKTKVMPDTSAVTAKINENSAKLDSLLKEKEVILNSIAKIKSDNSELKIATASKSALISSKSDDLSALDSELGGVDCDLDNAKTRLAEKLQLLKFFEQKDLSEIMGTLEETLGYFEMVSNKITVLADNASVSSLAEAEEKLAALSRDSSIIDLSEAEIDSLKERFKAQSDNTSALRAELASINEKIKATSAATPPVAVLERERLDLAEKIKGYTEFCETVDIANGALDEAFRDLRKNYSEVLDQRTAEIFTQLSSDKYLSVSVSKSMELGVTTDEAFGLKESDYLSRGTEEQLYLAMRLAVAELITNEGEKLPVFADDPLSQYDDGRVLKAVSFLKDYSKDKQIIMFTCHSFIKSVAEKLGIQIKEM